ncbi:unnamed protein product, partial [Protopolystoma xenopodis]
MFGSFFEDVIGCLNHLPTQGFLICARYPCSPNSNFLSHLDRDGIFVSKTVRGVELDPYSNRPEKVESTQLIKPLSEQLSTKDSESTDQRLPQYSRLWLPDRLRFLESDSSILSVDQVSSTLVPMRTPDQPSLAPKCETNGIFDPQYDCLSAAVATSFVKSPNPIDGSGLYGSNRHLHQQCLASVNCELADQDLGQASNDDSQATVLYSEETLASDLGDLRADVDQEVGSDVSDQINGTVSLLIPPSTLRLNPTGFESNNLAPERHSIHKKEISPGPTSGTPSHPQDQQRQQETVRATSLLAGPQSSAGLYVQESLAIDSLIAGKASRSAAFSHTRIATVIKHDIGSPP